MLPPYAKALRSIALILLMATAGCAAVGEMEGAPRKESIYAVTTANSLIRFNAGQPQRVLGTVSISGLASGETLLGIDYRVARGVLFGIGSSGRLYTIDAKSGAATAVGSAPIAIAPAGREFGFDFNPVVDRIRFVSDTGQNMRLHPDTGAVVDANADMPGLQIDGPLAYSAGDGNAGKTPRVMAAAYTYNKTNEKITTNFAIDGAAGTLVTQGTREGVTPGVSPNTGQLFTVGPLNVGPMERVSFDIADVNNAAFAAITSPGAGASRLYLISLDNGAATLMGTIGGGQAVRGIAIEP